MEIRQNTKNTGYHKVNNKKGKNEKFISKNGVKRLRGSEKTQKCLKWSKKRIINIM